MLDDVEGLFGEFSSLTGVLDLSLWPCWIFKLSSWSLAVLRFVFELFELNDVGSRLTGSGVVGFSFGISVSAYTMVIKIKYQFKNLSKK